VFGGPSVAAAPGDADAPSRAAVAAAAQAREAAALTREAREAEEARQQRIREGRATSEDLAAGE
jgi:hypothetical protein